MTTPFDGITPLPHLGVIRAEGDDAVKFLHGQLTHDFALLDLQHARLTAFLSAKGRMQASFIGFKRSPTEVLLVCSRDLLTPTLKRISMFVMRAKAKLSDASEEFLLYGLAGSAIEKVAGSAMQTSAKADLGNISIIGLPPADTVPRALWVAPAGTPAPEGTPLAEGVWAWGEVQSGVATLTAPLVDTFVPQMLNYESVDGVSFKKGCYPGQEVVARSQFRGAIKRRAFIAHADAPLHAGEEVFSAAEPEQACGMVAQTAPAPGGGSDAIVVLQLSAAESGALHAGSADGQVLRLGTLPYALKDDL
ncbi:YgfZ/GcvT domain-containing protein [Simplicispira hankyongi]|uniref:Folate-binding protein n=1 Tax=Simplicispira hankyongi TaxID=2315688 RepID=A0A398C7S1_9BURK|nr:folate-binding protein YgfZ [Simplicispira hankyongi]RID99145.1 folate-binding protein [Simplicispira hankyongi]